MGPTRRDAEIPDPRVNLAIRDYLERLDRGEVVDQDQFLSEYADVADALQSFISNSDDVARAIQDAGPMEGSVLSTNSILRNPRETKAGSSRTAVPAARELPEIFGKYRVLRQLGRGAMGEVYLAQDASLQRLVALKIPRFAGDQTEELLARFYREARISATLRNANICPVHDVGQIDGQHYIAMAYIDGRTLAEVIKQDAPLGERPVLILIRKLALALQEAHDGGIIHRDLKPGNVMIDSRAEPVVMDFGLACQIQSEDAARLTHDGVLIGSPAYMSPEQVESQHSQLTPLADQYSLGVILYELLTSKLPFQGTVAAVIGQIMSKEPVPPRKLRTDLDPRVEALCLKMMAKSAKDRFPSMKAVAEQTLKILREPYQPPAATTSSTKTTKPAASTGAEIKQQVTQLVEEGELSAVLDILKPVAARKEGKLGEWAREKRAELLADVERWQHAIPRLCELAQRLIAKHDYAEAKKTLSAVPTSLRTETLNDLLEEAAEKDDECTVLQKEIEQAIQQSRPQDLPPLVKRFLQLKPGHRGMQSLARDLKKYGPERAMKLHKGQSAFLDPAGQLFEMKHITYSAGAIVALFVVVYMAVIAYQTPHGTVVIEIHDPKIKVQFDHDAISFETTGKSFRLKTTEQRQLQVEYNGLAIGSAAQSISVSQNETKVITARLVSGQVDLQIAGQKHIFPVPDGRGEKPTKAPDPPPEVNPPIFPNEDSYPSLASFVEVDRLVQWTPLEITSFQSAGGASHRKLGDLSVLVTGENPSMDNYTVKAVAPAALNRITAFKLEALTDGTIGPGRDEHGNIAVSRVLFRIGNGQPLPIRGALADYTQWEDSGVSLSDRPANQPIPVGAVRDDGWSISAHIPFNRVSRSVILTPEQPPTPTPGQLLQFDIEHQTRWSQHTLMRFRISVTSDTVDLALDPIGANRRIAQANPASIGLLSRGYRWNPANLQSLPNEDFALADVHFNTGSKVDAQVLNDLTKLTDLRSITVSSRNDVEQIISRPKFLDRITIWNCSLTDSLGWEIGKRRELRDLHIWGSKQDNPAVLIRLAPRTIRFMWLLDIRQPDAETWRALSALPRLRTLWINCDLEPTDLPQLARLASLEEISLRNNPKIKDGDLEQLPTMARLRKVFLPIGPFTEAAINKLQQRMPHLEVVTGENGQEKSYPPLQSPPANTTTVSDANTANAQAGNWTNLFNGKDLTGWQQLNHTTLANNPDVVVPVSDWIVTPVGTLKCLGKSHGMLRTVREYSNFELSCQLKMPVNGDTGIYLPLPETVNVRNPGTGFEVQLAPSYAPAAIFGGQGSGKMLGGRYLPAGEWNDVVILFEAGKLIRTTLNGAVACEADLTDPNFSRTPRKSFIGLQDWQNLAKDCEFRNIRIRELSPGEQANASQPKPVPAPAPTLITKLETPNPQAGLKMEIYRGTDFRERFAILKAPNIDLQQDMKALPTSVRFASSIRWTGRLVVPKEGEYVLTASSDDGIRVWLDDPSKPVLDDWGSHKLHDFSQSLKLQAREYKLKVEFWEGWNTGIGAVLKWKRPGETTAEIIPASAFLLPTTDLDLTTRNAIDVGPAKIVIANARDSGGAASWQMTTKAPHNYRVWLNLEKYKYGPEFQNRPGPFGSDNDKSRKTRYLIAGHPVVSEWKTDEIWLRTEVDLPDDIRDAEVTWDVFHDDSAEIYANGQLVKEFPRFSKSYDIHVEHPGTTKLDPGMNVICVHAKDVVGTGYKAIDVGLRYQYLK